MGRLLRSFRGQRQCTMLFRTTAAESLFRKMQKLATDQSGHSMRSRSFSQEQILVMSFTLLEQSGSESQRTQAMSPSIRWDRIRFDHSAHRLGRQLTLGIVAIGSVLFSPLPSSLHNVTAMA